MEMESRAREEARAGMGGGGGGGGFVFGETSERGEAFKGRERGRERERERRNIIKGGAPANCYAHQHFVHTQCTPPCLYYFQFSNNFNNY